MTSRSISRSNRISWRRSKAEGEATVDVDRNT